MGKVILSWEEMEVRFPTSTVMWDMQSVEPVVGHFTFYTYESFPNTLRAENRECTLNEFCDCRIWNGNSWVCMFRVPAKPVPGAVP
jgi:hypothetical protein